MKNDINRWVFEIPLEDILSEKNAKSNFQSENGCICCGKPISPKAKKTYYVHLLTNGNLVSTDQPFADDEDQGFAPIGNGCKNKLPNNFYFEE